MSEYTAEDFKNANIAVRGTLHAARRAEPDTTLPWVYGDNEWDDDKGMVENGWRPIHEHNPHATGTPEEEVQNLRDANAGLKMRVEYLNGELVLWQERLWQERASQAEAHARKAEAAPLTLDSAVREMQEKAWDECARSAGDMASPLMDQNPYRDDQPSLKRAPQPEPWQALADMMIEADLSAALSIPELAEALHQSGVRVVGGDET